MHKLFVDKVLSKDFKGDMYINLKNTNYKYYLNHF